MSKDLGRFIGIKPDPPPPDEEELALCRGGAGDGSLARFPRADFSSVPSQSTASAHSVLSAHPLSRDRQEDIYAETAAARDASTSTWSMGKELSLLSRGMDELYFLCVANNRPTTQVNI